MATQQITGLASGLDTASIIESLMAIQRTTYDKTSEKVQMEKLKLQAYQSINSMLYSLKDTVNNLASSSLWNGKMATSSNDASVKASVTQYAAEGSYSFRVGQLATAAQYLSKGFSSASSTVISSNSGVTSGSVTLESSKARVDNSAKLEDLNGGNGVYRGSIRITDAAGSTAVVDISTCETLDQVITAINNAAGVQVQAQIKQNPDGTSTGDRLEIIDTSGLTTGTMRIQNVGSGTAATDLGIAQTSTLINGAHTIEGTSIWYMSNNTSLSLLNDGLGVEEGYISLDIAGALGTAELYFNVDGCETVGDIMNVINQVLSQTVELGRQPGATAEQVMAADYCDGLQIEINADRNGFIFTGGQTGLIYTLTNAQQANAFGNLTPATQLGMVGTYTVPTNGGSFECSRVFGDVSSPMLSNVSGVNQTGIGTEGSRQKVTSNTLNGTTLLSALNGGAGILSGNGFTFYVHQGGDANGVHATYSDIFDTNILRSIATDPTATVDDLLLYLNTTLSTCGIDALETVQIAVDPGSKGLYFTGLSNGYAYEVGGDLATSLGLVYLEDGDPSRGWGAMLKGADYEDPTVSSLFDAVDIRNGTLMLYESHTLADLFSQTDIDRITAAGSLSFTIGTCSFSVDLTGLDENTTLAEFMKEVNDQIAVACEAHDPTMMVPKIQIHYLSEGLSFTNVDLSQPLIITGDAANIAGLARNYAGMSFGSFNATTQLNLNPTMTGTHQQEPLTGSELLSSLNAGAGLSLLGNELTISFGPEGSQETITLSRDEIIAEMGGGHFGAYTLNQYVAALNSLVNQKIAADPALAGADIQFGLTSEGITVLSAQSLNDGDLITIGGDMATASSTGLNAWEYEYDSGITFVSPDAADIRSVTSTAVTVAGLGIIEFEWNGSTYYLETNTLSQSSTLNDLIGVLNSELMRNGITNMSFGISDSGSGISFTNNSDKAVTFIYDDVNTLASDLGLAGVAGSGDNRTVAGNGHFNSSSLNRNYISRATTLASLNHGQGADLGTFIITNAAGTSVRIDMSEALTIGDAIDFINGALYGVQARINAAGDGIEIVQTVFVDNDGNPITGNISVTSADGTKTAEHLGIAGTGSRDENGCSVLNGSFKTVIDIGTNDTLNDVMTRISELDGYSASIINDGTGGNSYRLSIKSSSTGAGHDFIIDSDLDVLGMQQVSRGRDSMVLYGDPNSGMSPVVLKSSTNTNNQAIQGMTLELLDTTENYTTITVSADTESAVQEIQNLVQAYNDLSDLITYLDSYDTVNETKGILFSDSNVRTLMSTIDDVFFQVFNPDNLTYADLVAAGKKSTWTWTDLGISFSTNNTNTDGESGNWYSRMELDLDTLNEMVVNNWDSLKDMLSSQRNISDSTLAANIAATSYFNFQPEYDSLGNIVKPADQWDPNGAINGNRSSSNFGDGNGFAANKTIAEGENQYTVYFQQAATLDRVSIYHPNSADYPSSEYALKDFVVEYLDPNTGQWVVMREVNGNSSSSTILGFATPVTTTAIRITASSTNAEDGKFRLLDVQCLESNGLAGKLNRTINELTDVVDGFFTLANESVEDRISSLQEQMERMETRLTKKEEALWRKFNAMESALSKLQSQSNYFTTMMSSMMTSS